jgi:hypothetical protein
MATPAQIGFFGAARITGIMQGLSDPRLLPIPLTWNARIPDVPATDEEVSAKYVGTLLIADLIADDAKAVTYTQGRFQYQTLQAPNIKMGIGMNQAMVNALERIRAMGGVPNDDVGFFTNRYNQNIADCKFGVELRKEAFKLGMLLDGFSYDRLGIKMNGVTWGMYSDLKVTPSTGWATAGSATPLTDINTVRSIAQQRYGINLNRATMTTPALRAMVATTEYQNQVKSINFAVLLGAPQPTAPLQTDQLLRRQAEIIIGGTGEPFAIEIDDRRYWFQDNNGAVTSNRLHPVNKVLLTSTANDGNANAYDFANCPVTESLVANAVGGAPSVIGGGLPAGRGPIGYATLADQNLNPPGLVTWGVARGAPRKHMNQSSAVLTVGALSETYDTSVPAVL